MQARIHTRTTCRLCGAGGLERFLHFSNMPLTDEFVSAEQRGQEFAADLDIYLCPTCHGAQTLHDVEVMEYYRDYGYTVSGSTLAQRFMQRLAEQTFRRFNLRAGSRVIEIGSGDGYQLACFHRLGAAVLGFEPSNVLNAAARAQGVPVVEGLFDAQTVARIPAEMRPAQVVLLTYTFDHLPEPLALLEAVRPVLDPQRGVLLIEVHDLDRIMERCETCLFAHEHTIYLQRRSMQRLLERAGMKLLTTELVAETERRANSLLIAAAPAASTLRPDPFAVIADRPSADEWDRYTDFAERVDRVNARLRMYVHGLTGKGRRVAGYGAGGRGVMMLAQTRLGADDIAFLCDRNPSFHGLFTPVTHIPVAPPQRLLDEHVDETIVFSFGYLNEIRTQLAAYEQGGGRFVSLLDLLR